MIERFPGMLVVAFGVAAALLPARAVGLAGPQAVTRIASQSEELSQGAVVQVRSSALPGGWRDGVVGRITSSDTGCVAIFVREQGPTLKFRLVPFSSIVALRVNRARRSEAASAPASPSPQVERSEQWTEVEIAVVRARYERCDPQRR